MISVCIPVYNFDIGPTVKKLLAQFEQSNVPGEVVILDDGSDEPYRKKLEQIKNMPAVHLVHQQNKGRSYTRNRLAQLAHYDDLIFIDSDCDVPNNFIEIYSQYPAKKFPLVIGGLSYPDRPKEKNKTLRWKVGIARECQNATARQIRPNQGFLSSNFKISKHIFDSISFDQNLQKYGHEDTVFGASLKKAGIPFTHIDNPVIHLGIDEASIYLVKIERSIENLIELMSNDRDFSVVEEVKLLKLYDSMPSIVKKMTGFIFQYTKSIIKWNLCSYHPSLRLFDFYKLGLLCYLNDGRQQKR